MSDSSFNSEDCSDYNSSDEDFSYELPEKRTNKRTNTKKHMNLRNMKKRIVDYKTDDAINIFFLGNLSFNASLNASPKTSEILKTPEIPKTPETPETPEKIQEENIEIEEFYGPDIFSESQTKELKFTKAFDSLEEMIILGESYDPSFTYNCVINMKRLHNLVEPLKELNNMIGLNDFKQKIIDQIIYLLTTDLNKDEKPMLHTCLYGTPGSGKTECGKILSKIFAASGFLSVGDFKVVKREDLVAEYIGQTAVKTKKLLEEMKGSSILLDEIYSFGSYRGQDYFANEAVNTLNVFLSENYNDFICIIAGYEEDVKTKFFSINQGLERRFPFKYTFKPYSAKELAQIFLKFVTDEGWNHSPGADEKYLTYFFETNKNDFPNYGGDIKTFFDKCKIAHTRKSVFRIDCADNSSQGFSHKKCLCIDDIEEGFSYFLKERNSKKDDYSHIYM